MSTAQKILRYTLIPVGIMSGLIAAVFGLADWTKIPPGSRARRVGLQHALGNVVVLILYGISWLLRRDSVTDPSALALAASLAGGALAAVTGWLGGELVDRLGVGVHPGANVDAPSSPVSEMRSND